MSLTVVKSDPQAPIDLVRFHLSLNVDDLAASIAFFQSFFDAKPAKQEQDYAKFEVDEPPLVLSLLPGRTARGGKLNHLGFRLTSPEALVAMQQRLEMQGLSTQREEGVECCHSRQTKFWLHDPDGNVWEIYTLEVDGEHCTAGAGPKASELNHIGAPAPAIWAHRLGEAFGPKLMVESGGVDEVLLEGTFNARLSPAERRDILREVGRILKPGARVMLHQLSARSPLASLAQRLPGPAAAVEAVPSAEQLVDELQSAGFVDLHFEKLGDAPCFIADGIECRETRLVGFKPRQDFAGENHQVLYKGPFRQAEDDHGHTFRRGQWTTVDAATWNRLHVSPNRDQFVL